MIVFLILVVVFIIVLQIPEVKGFIGESIVKVIIGKTSDKPEQERFVVNNFLIQLENGKTSQTDHVLVNRNGVFVIETKNYSGRIYGNDIQREWTQVLNYGKVKNQFYSPVKQNATHVHHIKELLPDEFPVHSVVVFVKGNTEHIDSKHVYNLFGLHRAIHKTGDNLLTVEQMKEIYAILSQNNKSQIISNAEHVRNIRQTQADIENHICPRCAGKLVRRHGKNGDFWGCSNYPSCKFTKKI